MIYDILFNRSYGKVHCPFHEGDDTASLSIAPDGKFHCFACSVGGGSEISFVQQYYNVSRSVAERFIAKLNNLPTYRYEPDLSDEDKKYLDSIGISKSVQSKMLRASSGKLIYPHYYKGVEIDHTWFNYSNSVAHDPTKGKYSRDFGSVSGFLTPYRNLNRDTIIIVEGEKDMLTMLSHNIPAVSIVGGANTMPYMVQRELKDKKIVIIYDCDVGGRDGSLELTHWLYSIGATSVKNVDLGLQDKEDVNDWFEKYKFSRADLIQLINVTPIATNDGIKSAKALRFFKQASKQLTEEEFAELTVLINNKNASNNGGNKNDDAE